ncbi:hypothetical protein [Carnobacterium mobile]|uniref:hypothetical protein n=1 Tax=Carnobacterium mobile TaxID=2750 RepID=UPI0018683B1A|nr:hypothetical protein [Carnobacterium mobile]
MEQKMVLSFLVLVSKMNLFHNLEIFGGIVATCSHVKDVSKGALWAWAQVYHVCKTAEAATAMTRLES